MDIEKIIDGLHPLERKVLAALRTELDFDRLAKKSKLKDVELARALVWMEGKGIVKLQEQSSTFIEPAENGKRYLAEGLPERRLLKALEREHTLPQLQHATQLTDDEISVSIGILKKKQAITVRKDAELKIARTATGNEYMRKKFIEETFLKELPLKLAGLSAEQAFAYEELKKRKAIVTTVTIKKQEITVTELGKRLLVKDVKQQQEYLETLTPEMLKTGSWKNKRFRTFDIAAPVPRIYPGKRHFTNQAVEYARRIWLDLGFSEMHGRLLHTSFWNFDALFTAQDHPVRDMQDTFFIKDPEKGKLPDKELVKRTKTVHENGWTTGSTGWRYAWREEESKKNVLRTHTTVLSARTIAALKESDLPAKFFAIGKCFRNETLDWSHLFEFDQVEGIVVDPDANFKHLIGYLKNFFLKMGYKAVRVRPAYFPYTEMSAEVDVLHPVHNKWIELAGSGIFRPEVVKPLLGKDVPVIAWGLGFPRTIAEYYKITDIRDLYRNDLRQLREMKLWMK
ncbi:phenylalanine--tRNA ligase subunit alpha [Candidatus Woesearchaeota archaeon]|nr:phenylalanine--tRNA ligase subunit alpha [Candidatus Woesearchaeota archaeon]